MSHTVATAYTMRNYLWYDSSSCPVGWVGNFENGCKWIVSIRAVVAPLAGALTGFNSPCQAFRRHFSHRRDRESQSLCFDTGGWQPFVVIPPHSAWLYSCYSSSKSFPVLCVFFLHFRFLTSSMSFRLCMFLVPVYVVIFDKITSVWQPRQMVQIHQRFRYRPHDHYQGSFSSLFPQHIYLFVV